MADEVLFMKLGMVKYSRHTVERINRIILNFIWDGKPAKIKKKKSVIAKRKHGGLKMIDFELMEKSLKEARKGF